MDTDSQTASLNTFAVIERLKNNLKELQKQFPEIQSVEDPVSMLEKIPTKLPLINGKLVLVTAFCGPSGAGKSTLFNLLTGLDSPTSDIRRPNSFGSLVAIPKEVFDSPERNDYLPNFKIDYLKSPVELLDENIPKDKLFIEPYEMKFGNKSNWIYIADIPDFNSVAVSNWEKTEQMIQRADSIIFVSTEEGYSDRKTIEYFIKVLRISGKVIYLLTRNKSAEVAQQILSKHLIDNIKRVDSSAVSELGKCHFYYSLLKETPTIEDIQPSALNSNSSFIDEIFTNQDKNTILSSFCSSVKKAADLGEYICNDVLKQVTAEEDYRNLIENQIRTETEFIVGDKIPLLQILIKIFGEIQIRRYDLVKRKLFALGNKIKNIFV
ncbi:MAG: ATP-binding cassette domain-containing protein, partial [Candidatus Riflebacteria bacterium]|nr:ATP-binding cassette domain-containing protein [Candidatus Riflebacteria bacterium]